MSDMPYNEQIGMTGISAPAGMLRYRDDNPILSDQSRRYGDGWTLGAFESAYKTDPSVKGVIGAILRPLSAALNRSEIDANGAPQVIADYVRWLLFESSQNAIDTWGKQEIRSFLVNGFSLSNHVAYLDDKRRWYGLRKMSPRPAWTIDRWFINQHGEWMMVQQQVQTPAGYVANYRIPRNVLCHWVVDPQGEDPTGEPLLRSVHMEIKARKLIRQRIPVFVDREVLGVPAIWLPQKTSPADKAAAKALVKNLRSHEESYLMMPVESKIEWKHSNKEGGDVLIRLMAALGEIIRESAGQEVRSLGTSQTGSRAVGEVLDDQFSLGIDSYGSTFENPINNQLIPRFVDWTFGPQPRYPIYRIGGIRRQDTKAALDLLVSAKGAELIEVTSEVRRKAYDLIGVPFVEPAAPVAPVVAPAGSPAPVAPAGAEPAEELSEVAEVGDDEEDVAEDEVVQGFIFDLGRFDEIAVAKWLELNNWPAAKLSRGKFSIRADIISPDRFGAIRVKRRGVGVRELWGTLTEEPDAAPEQGEVSLARTPRREPPRQRIWRSTIDEKTCKICKALDGKVSRSGLWRVKGGIVLDSAPAHENCRCHTEPAV